MHADHAGFYNKFWDQKTKQPNGAVDNERAKVLIDALESHFELVKIPGTTPSIVDIGCGMGWVSELLTEFGTVTGLDYSGEAIEIARSRFSDITFRQADLLDLKDASANGIFDIGVCSEVIEHIPDLSKPRFVSVVSQIIRKEGLLILTTPNQHAWTPYWMSENAHDWKQPVEDWCTPNQLREFFVSSFDCVHMHTFNFRFSNRGRYRIINSYKVNRIAQALYLLKAFDQLKKHRFGLYTIGVFVRK